MAEPNTGRTAIVVGAGAMGRAAIGALLESGARITAVDASGDTRQALNSAFAAQRDRGTLRVLEAVSEIEDSDGSIMLLFLPNERIIRSVIAPAGEFISPGSVETAVDFGTNSAGFAREMARVAASANVVYLDAPILGRPDKVGKWVVPVGGDGAARARLGWVFEVLAVNAPHVGPAGSGAILKSLNQLMFGAINTAAAEIAAIADAAGIDKRTFFETVTGSSAATVSGLFTEIGRRIVADEYTAPTFTIDLLAKDVKLARDLAESVGVRAPLIAEIVGSTEHARANGLGTMDTAAAWLAVRGLDQTTKGNDRDD